MSDESSMCEYCQKNPFGRPYGDRDGLRRKSICIDCALSTDQLWEQAWNLMCDAMWNKCRDEAKKDEEDSRKAMNF